MNRNQGIALAIGVANLLLITLFPLVDQYSIAASNIPVFAGFHFITQRPPLGIVNADLLTIEIIVVLVNLPSLAAARRQVPQRQPPKRIAVVHRRM